MGRQELKYITETPTGSVVQSTWMESLFSEHTLFP